MEDSQKPSWFWLSQPTTWPSVASEEHHSVMFTATRFWGTPVGRELAEMQDGPAASEVLRLEGFIVVVGFVTLGAGEVALMVWGLLEGAALVEAALLPEEVLILVAEGPVDAVAGTLPLAEALPVAEGPVDAIAEALPLAGAIDIVKPPLEMTDADGCVKSVHDPAHEMP